MITAEECIPCKYDVLSIHPVFLVIIVITIPCLVYQIHIPSIGPQSPAGYGDFVRKQVITPLCSERAGKAHERHLHRCWTSRENLVPCAPSVAIQVDQDMDTVTDNLLY